MDLDHTHEDEQHGCSLTNLAACVCVPAGMWIGFQLGRPLGGMPGAVAGALIGGILSVPAALLMVLILLSIAQLGFWLTYLIVRIFNRR